MPPPTLKQSLKDEASYWMDVITEGTLTIHFCKGQISRLEPCPSIMEKECGKYRKVVDKV